MAEPKKINTRIINKHATAAVWNAKTTFIPLQAEIIVYDKDAEYTYERYKIGDGSTPVTQLPFVINPHTHKFKGTATTLSTNYTPAGSVKVTHKPKGTISKTVTAVTPTTKSLKVVTAVGEDVYTPETVVFPTLKSSDADGVLTLDVSGGEFTQSSFVQASRGTTEFSYVEAVVITQEEPTFTGTEETIDGTFIGTQSTISTAYTPEGSIETP